MRRLLILVAVFFFAGAVHCPSHEAWAGVSGISEMNVMSRNLREAGAQAYLLGVLGGRSEYLIEHPFVLGGWGRDGGVFEVAWYYGIAYPATSWAWSGATIELMPHSQAGRLEVLATKPIAALRDSASPRSVREWMTANTKKIKTEQVTRELVIDNSGMLQMSEQAYRDMRAKVVSDINEGLRWCLENRGDAKTNRELKAHLERVMRENAFSSTVRLEAETEKLLTKVMREVFGSK